MQNTAQRPKVTLITGAARRLGAAMARRFHQEGHSIIVHYNSSDKAARQVCEQLNEHRSNSAITIQAALNSKQDIEALAQQSIAWRGHVDVLINNASSYYPTPLGSCTQAQWDDLFASNLKGAFFLTQALAPALREAEGCVLNMTDIYADTGLPEHAPYVMAKAGVKAMTKTLARELAPKVRVNGISPGAILWPDTPPDAAQLAKQQHILSTIPLARTGNEDDIANVAWFLCTQASYVSGQTIRVDGGRSLGISL
ncbi:MAG: pteridine reductase [Pseudohongiellaceae bacterium]|nr:pteridine reductase [Pseudohongiellaceae bacterium]